VICFTNGNSSFYRSTAISGREKFGYISTESQNEWLVARANLKVYGIVMFTVIAEFVTMLN